MARKRAEAEPKLIVEEHIDERTGVLLKRMRRGVFGKSADRSTKRAAQKIQQNVDGAFRRDQWQNLSFQLNDIVTGLASGQRPMQVLAQQGGQVYQVMQQAQGGVGGAAKAIAGLVTPARLMDAAAAGSAALAIASFAKWQAQTEALTDSLNGLGRRTGLGPQGLAAAGGPGRRQAEGGAYGSLSAFQVRDLAGVFARNGYQRREHSSRRRLDQDLRRRDRPT